MPQAFRPLFTAAQTVGLINNEAAFLGSTATFLSALGAALFGVVSHTIIENTQIEVLNQLILANNVGEINQQNLVAIATNTQLIVQQQNDAIPLWENIAENVFTIASQMAGVGGAVDLSTVEFNLQSILRDTSTIALAMGGGAPLGFGDIVAALAAQTDAITAGLADVGASVGEGAFRVTGGLTTDVAGTLAHATDVRLNAINDTLQQLKVLLVALSGVGDPATQKIAENTNKSALTDLVTAALGDRLNNPDADEYADWIVNSGPFDLLKSVGNPVKLIRNLAQNLAPDFGTVLGAEVVSEIATGATVSAAVQDSTLWALGKGPEYILKLASKVLAVTEKLAIDLTPKLQDFWQPEFEKLLDDAKNAVLALGETGPKDGFANAKILLSKAAINGMRAHHRASAMEMIPYAKELGMHTLSAFMSNMAGFNQIANNTWGQAITQAVGRPAGYELNASTRSRIPDVGMLEQMVFEREMTEAEQAVLLAYHGFNDDYIARIQRIQYREPNLRQLSSLAADASMTEGQVANWLQEGGFHERDVKLLTPIVMQQSMRAERGTLVTEVMANLRAGLLTEADAELSFDRLNLQPAAREMLFTSARLGLRRNSIEDNITTYKQLYGDGLLDDSDFRLGLQAQGVTNARLQVELDQVASKRFAKVAESEAAESKAEIRKQQGLLISAMREAFQHGMIDAGQFETTLEHSGITRSTAQATVQLEVLKLEGRALTSRSAEAARILQREQRLREDTFVELFRKGAITNLQLQHFLEEIGLPAPVVAAIVDRELARIRPSAKDLLDTPGALKAKELFTLAKAKLQVQFAKAAISADQYLTQLVALGVDVDIARATVALEVARRGAEKQPPAAATKTSAELAALKKQVDDALEKFGQTDQTQAALEAILERLSLAEEVIDALVARANEAIEAAATAETAVS